MSELQAASWPKQGTLSESTRHTLVTYGGFSREWDTVIVSGSMHYNNSGQQNHATAKETIPTGWRPYGDNHTGISYGIIGAVNANWCNFVRPDGVIIMLGNTEAHYSGVTGGWQCREWRD